ncbi:Flagellar M-ring protein [Rhodobacteraceae bacterium THAF1]|uniref:flagellar basal-body MS-ring/collar protein FliF n=1 Tax=Palleronia sp. THAF1 TaxID=2587842 RepID=UPI000F3AB906|nr:flagellar basal-body MS-ring/collar protein FliF [Palleronia sp. THAF1]QFU10273.1 Flagellar M-ring protein [Palleronia sp. THAF1]VDC16822.1 Flagellar M-ring protein [Rhodobacteraceae bacterium THAF1]
MQQIVSSWAGLTVQRRIMVVGATVAMFALVLMVARMASRPDMDLLYSGLESGAAGEVVAALDARGVVYDVRGGAIFVDSTQRDALRMTLASEGLPQNVSQGYELLDGMSGFGTTSQMFDAAYWRATEGELARTIVASPAIQNARVHIANTGTKPFQREAVATASVTVTPSGGGLSSAHARALRYLVASAVSGLAPENVSVIDATGGVILAGEDTNQGAGASGDRAAELKRNVERLLEARVGYGKVVVEVNVETMTETEQITERRIDPDSRIAISQDVTQSSSTNADGGGGQVTVASNLPDGDGAEQGGGSSSSQSNETRETTNFEVSQIERQVTRSPGAIDRITTAVLIDGIQTVDDTGATVWTERPEAEIEALTELVSAAVGYDPERGDSLSVRSMQFEAVPQDGTAPVAASLFGPIDAMRLAQIAILGIVALVLGLFVVRPIMAKPTAPALAAPADISGAPMSETALTGEIDPDDMPDFMGQAGQPLGMEPTAAADATAPTSAVDRLRQLIDERQDESLEILRSWMEDESEKA